MSPKLSPTPVDDRNLPDARRCPGLPPPLLRCRHSVPLGALSGTQVLVRRHISTACRGIRISVASVRDVAILSLSASTSSRDSATSYCQRRVHRGIRASS